MKYLLILTALLFSCSHDTSFSVPDTKEEPVQTDPVDKFIEVEFEASRNYGPSTFNPQTITLLPGVYELPEVIWTDSGNAGTGWFSFTVSDYRYCYQGISPSNSVISNTFEYEGRGDSDKECFNQTLSNADLDFVTDQVDIKASVHGGGCGSNCQETIVSGVILGLIE